MDGMAECERDLDTELAMMKQLYVTHTHTHTRAGD